MSTVAAIAGATAGAAIAKKLAEYASRTGGNIVGEHDSSEYLNLQGDVDRLEQLLEDSIKQDADSANSIWNELQSLWNNHIHYFKEKQRFNGEVERLLSEARGLMKKIRELTAEPIKRIPIPDELYQVADQWESVYTQTSSVNKNMPPLKETGDWGGPSAGNYQTMTDVQINATSEYVNMPFNLQVAYRLSGDYNKTVLSKVHELVSGALLSGNACYGGAEGQFYVKTSAVRNALWRCANGLPEALNMTDEASQELAKGITDVQQSAVIIGPGWPTGTAMAGRQAGDTQFQHPHHAPEYEGPRGIPKPEGPPKRW